MSRAWNKQLEDVKRKIVDGRDRGVCDRDGNTIDKYHRGSGKGDRHRLQRGGFRKYQDSPYWDSR